MTNERSPDREQPLTSDASGAISWDFAVEIGGSAAPHARDFGAD